MEDRALRREVVPRVKVRVAKELKEAAMEGVRTRLRSHVDDPTGEAAVLGVDVARKDAEFRNRVEVRDDAGLLPDCLLHACAIEVIGVVGLALTKDGELPRVGLTRGRHGAEAPPELVLPAPLVVTGDRPARTASRSV